MKVTALATIFLICSSQLVAQDFSETKTFQKTEEESSTEGEELTTGTDFKATAAANLIENTNVIGQSDGVTNVYNLGLDLTDLRLKEGSEIESTVSVVETFSKTPALDRIVKTDDILRAKSTYKNYLSSVTWLAMFARIELQAPLMDGFDEQAEETTYAVANLDDTTDTITDTRFKLNDGFAPLVTKESLGALASVMKKKVSTIEVRSGLGAKQIQAKGQYIVDDKEDTADVIEVRELDNISLVGIEMGLEAKGKVKGFEYKLYAEALYPLSYSPKTDEDPDPKDLVTTEAGLDLSYALESWLAMTYRLNSRRDPLLTDQAQVTQSYLLALTYAFDSRK